MVNGEKALNAKIEFKKDMIALCETKHEDFVRLLSQKAEERKNNKENKFFGKQEIASYMEEFRVEKDETRSFLDKQVKKYGKSILKKTEMQKIMGDNLGAQSERIISM